ncbi:phosphatidylinositol-4 kinase plasma membrane scaffold Efr3 [Schizosaccharomyces osmophilus]|uniref:Phosphatidylinositol-4 kinase plasma membrane scaffold Efr3 n=1 Tax=Schizosaccharomyces osmophilus TaxID=2545709 RepID=A0AAE9WH49_9SCHI|nr:phosphatidylinositol-4 kinase plasma membrane scaffold Efr3 [Schizosaccharomyces osmophilus]WBW74826.1 phosphatidylinositol-4 kinase plasma membrane scaffold Efr3 [Schizosaccharomyces osmophilus]
MWLLFRSKHKKLVLKCFPSRKIGGSEPNGSPLAYLSYYAASNSGKLRKVIRYLSRLVQHSVYRRRENETVIALKICRTLIQKCPENVMIMASEIVKILLASSNLKNLDVQNVSVDCFASFCERSIKTNSLAFGNEFYKSFDELVSFYFDLSRSESPPDPQQSRMLGLKAFHALTSCKLSNVEGESRSQPHFVIHAFLSNAWSKNEMAQQSFIALVRSTAQAFRPLPPSTTGISLPEHDEVGDTVEIANKKLSLRVLYNVYTQTNPLFMTESTKSLVHFFSGKSNTVVNQTYISVILNQIVEWTPVELRHSIFFCCLRCLQSSRIENANTNVLVPYMIYSILNSQNSIPGLSVIDVLREVEFHLLIAIENTEISDSEWYTLCASPTERLPRRLYLLLLCITSLINHQYYNEEFADVWKEMDSLSSEKATTATQLVVLTALDIMQMEQMEKERPSSVGTLSFIADFLYKAWPATFQRVYTSDSPFVRLKTVNVFFEFLNISPTSIFDFNTVFGKSTVSYFSALWSFIYEISGQIEKWLGKFCFLGEFEAVLRLSQKFYAVYGPITVAAFLPSLYRALNATEGHYLISHQALIADYLLYVSDCLGNDTLKRMSLKWRMSLPSEVLVGLDFNGRKARNLWDPLPTNTTSTISLSLDEVVSELLQKNPSVYPEESKVLFLEKSWHPKYSSFYEKIQKPTKTVTLSSSSENSFTNGLMMSDFNPNPIMVHKTHPSAKVDNQNPKNEKILTLKQALESPPSARTSSGFRTPSEITLSLRSASPLPLLDIFNMNNSLSAPTIQHPPYVNL